MKVLLIGVGMQGKAALHDLALNQEVTAITAADYDFEALQAYAAADKSQSAACFRPSMTSPTNPLSRSLPSAIFRSVQKGATMVDRRPGAKA